MDYQYLYWILVGSRFNSPAIYVQMFTKGTGFENLPEIQLL